MIGMAGTLESQTWDEAFTTNQIISVIIMENNQDHDFLSSNNDLDQESHRILSLTKVKKLDWQIWNFPLLVVGGLNGKVEYICYHTEALHKIIRNIHLPSKAYCQYSAGNVMNTHRIEWNIDTFMQSF